MDEKVRSILEQKIETLSYKIAFNKQKLKEKNYVVLVTGETSSGKSTLLNLILGEELLPYSTLSTTSTICELKYGATPKLVAHFKDKDPETGESTKTVWLGQSVESSQQSYLQEISSFVHVKTNRVSDFKKIELFWPHSLLKQGVVIVDSPGIGEADIMDNMVMEYFPEAFAFIYVINAMNAGGIQKDRVVKLVEHARNVTLSTQALFVCNKWDLLPLEETDEVKNHIIKELTKFWPSMNSDSLVIRMSSTNARKAQGLGIITEQFSSLMNGLNSMVLKSIEARLQTQWRFLENLLSNMVYQTKAFIKNSKRERSTVDERMKFITHRLRKMEKEQSAVKRELQECLESKTNDVVVALSRYLTSPDVIEKFISWTLAEVPITSWEADIRGALLRRLQAVILEWEEECHVLTDARTSLKEYFQERIHFVAGQLRNLETYILENDAAWSATGNFSLANIIDDSNITWVPGLVLVLLSMIKRLLFASLTVLQRRISGEINPGDTCLFMERIAREVLTTAVEETYLRSFVSELLKEWYVCLQHFEARVPKLIEADKMLCQRLREDNRSQREIIDSYQPLYQRSLQLRERMALFGIKDVRTMDISCTDLEWSDDATSLLGEGAFASVYRGTLKQRDEEHPVALKVWTDINVTNASVFLVETENLRKLNHPSIVKFYGAALQKVGDRVRGILVMELCKDNLMRHIFKNPKNIPSLASSTPATERNVIRWAKDIANALEFIHRQGLVHRDLKLENILFLQLPHEDVVKIADVGVSKEAKMITGTRTGTPVYVAPEVAKSSLYDSSADIYSFGIMMWEMWYGRRAFFEIGLDVDTHYDRVVDGIRPSHVDDRRMPPDGWQRLMEWCWDGEADKRPTAAICHEELTKLYQEAVPLI